MGCSGPPSAANISRRQESHEYRRWRNLCRGKTLIVIAHRLNTIREADRIIVLRNGQIAERGTHDELMALGGEYRNMVCKQTAKGNLIHATPVRGGQGGGGR
ncbi:MAG: hypothetical protein K6G18_06855 [Treponema sp.]|nr:hypothetical protein [Treponema sp.]